MAKRILISGGNFKNQGAHLMLMACIEEIRNRFHALPIVDGDVGSKDQRLQAGVGTLASLPSKGIYLQRVPRLPGKLRKLADWTPAWGSAEIDAVFDISGFVYGDQWESLNLRRRASNLQSWKDRGVPVYLLPQAFGPFDLTAEESLLALGSARFVMPRDPESEDHVSSLGLDTDVRIVSSPDFTATLEGKPVDRVPQGVPIIPNWNIASRSTTPGAYIDTLEETIRAVRAAGHDAYGLCHEGPRDLAVLQQLTSRMADFEILGGLDGLEAKYILGQAPFVVSGRFHASVSALTQGVPTISHGWSHKYRWLSQDFGVEDLQTDPYGGFETATHVVQKLVRNLESFSASATEGARLYKLGVSSMWDLVERDLVSYF